MTRASAALVCFTTLLLTIPALASAQANTAARAEADAKKIHTIQGWTFFEISVHGTALNRVSDKKNYENWIKSAFADRAHRNLTAAGRSGGRQTGLQG